MKIELIEQCKACKGTGLYKGMGERDGYAVVCHNCKGTGKYHFVHEYEEFTGKKERTDITRVLQVNPGICAGGNELDFGGVSYKDWLQVGTFPPKSEMRNFTCPAWWYQSADYSKKPRWNECLLCGNFSGCKHFKNKEQCWKRWDKENQQEASEGGLISGIIFGGRA